MFSPFRKSQSRHDSEVARSTPVRSEANRSDYGDDERVVFPDRTR